jgi:hypothetical protein
MYDSDTRHLDGYEEYPEPDRYMDCDRCGKKHQLIVRTSIAEAHRDPTEVYHLACGHAVI